MGSYGKGHKQASPCERPPEQGLRGETAWVWKQKHEILGPAVSQLAVVAVHASADGGGCVAKANPAAGSFHGAGEGDVFENVAGNGGVPANCFVGFPADKNELSVGRDDGRGRIADFRGR